jgi:hypothetical protein
MLQKCGRTRFSNTKAFHQPAVCNKPWFLCETPVEWRLKIVGFSGPAGILQLKLLGRQIRDRIDVSPSHESSDAAAPHHPHDCGTCLVSARLFRPDAGGAGDARSGPGPLLREMSSALGSRDLHDQPAIRAIPQRGRQIVRLRGGRFRHPGPHRSARGPVLRATALAGQRNGHGQGFHRVGKVVVF